LSSSSSTGGSRLNRPPSQPHARVTTHDDDDRDRGSDFAASGGAGAGSGSEKRSTISSRTSLDLEPNRPIFVDLVIVESAADGHDGGGRGGGPQAGLQFILTPPTPGK
jgi:hypothetical protein